MSSSYYRSHGVFPAEHGCGAGYGVTRIYCLPDGTSVVLTPFGNNFGMSSFLMVGNTMQDSPVCDDKTQYFVVVRKILQ